MNFKIEGLDDLEKSLKSLGKLPQKCVTGSARDGAKVAQAAAKSLAPKEDGDLIKGIVLKGEKKPPGKAKKVYEVMMDPKMNDVFVKTTKAGKRYYYPASMEYGFIQKDGKKHPGFHFLRNALTEHHTEIETAMIKKLSELIDKELRR